MAKRIPWEGLLIGLGILALGGAGVRASRKTLSQTGSSRRKLSNNQVLDSFEKQIEEVESVVAAAKDVLRKTHNTRLNATMTVSFGQNTKDNIPLLAYAKEISGKAGSLVKRLRNHFNEMNALQQKRLKKLQERAQVAVGGLDKVIEGHGIRERYADKAQVPLWGEDIGGGRGRKHRHDEAAPTQRAGSEKRKKNKGGGQQPSRILAPELLEELNDDLYKVIDKQDVRSARKQYYNLIADTGGTTASFFNKVAQDPDLLMIAWFENHEKNRRWLEEGFRKSPNFSNALAMMKRQASRYVNAYAMIYKTL